ncbi:hypothetical protein [Arsukibacterium sp.]|uniref:hypothetical protein n=1 Tax=Arsukibacterium sp. TaxID=1977258 RepID=UPI002FDA4CB2
MPVSTLSLVVFSLTLGQAAPAEMTTNVDYNPQVNIAPILVDGRSKLAAQLELMHYQQQQQLSHTIQQQSSQALLGIAMQATTSAQTIGVASVTLAQSALLPSRSE